MKDFRIIKYQDNQSLIEVRFSLEENTVYLTKEQLSKLFRVSRQNIEYHIARNYDGKEPEERATCKEILQVQTEGNRSITRSITLYNLDAIIALGNRIKATNLRPFLRWVDETFESIKNQIIIEESNIIRFESNNVSLDVRVSPEEDTVWLTKDDMVILFGRDRSVIARHIDNIFYDEELDIKRVCAKNARTGPDGKNYIIDYYNLDVVISVGYRVKSKNGVVFRKWATEVLKRYLLQGYAINDERAVVTKENYLELVNKVISVDNRVLKIEEKEQYHLVENKFIFDGKMFDASVLISKIIETAKEEIILIDPYVDLLTLDLFKDKKCDLTIITSNENRLSTNNINSFIHDYGHLTLKIDDRYHDRYLIIDNKMFYRLGASLNYLGKKLSQISLEESSDIIETLRKRIESI